MSLEDLLKQWKQSRKSDKIIKLWNSFASTRDEAIKQHLIMHYLGFCYSLANDFLNRRGSARFRIFYSSPDELVGMMYETLVQLIDNYDTSKNILFESYAEKRLLYAIHDTLRKERIFSRRNKVKTVSLDADPESQNYLDYKLKDDSQTSLIYNRLMISDIIEHLTPLEKFIFKNYYVKGYTQEYIARVLFKDKFGIIVTPSRISHVITQIRKKFMIEFEVKNDRYLYFKDARDLDNPLVSLDASDIGYVSNDFEQLRYIVFGRVYIFDSYRGKYTVIDNKHDLMLLSWSNIRHSKNKKFFNLYKRIQERHYRKGTYSIEQMLNLIFNTRHARAKFGNVCYAKDVKRNFRIIYSLNDDLELLKEYILGRRPVFDPKTNTEVHIRTKDDLRFLAQRSVLRLFNYSSPYSDLARLVSRFIKREKLSDKQFYNRYYLSKKSYADFVDMILSEPEAVSYFGERLSYSPHVSGKYSLSYNLDIIAQYVLGVKPIYIPQLSQWIKISTLDDLSYLNPRKAVTRADENKDLRNTYRRIMRSYRLALKKDAILNSEKNNSQNNDNINPLRHVLSLDECFEAIFSDDDVISYFGQKPSYIQHVIGKG